MSRPRRRHRRGRRSRRSARAPSDVFARHPRAGSTAARHWADLAPPGFPITVASRVDDAGELGADPAGAAGRWPCGRPQPALADGRTRRRRRAPTLGVFVGSTMGESAAFEAAAEGERGDLDDAAAARSPTASPRSSAAPGRGATYGTACAAGNYAIGAAARAVAAGRVDVAVAGGVDPFSRIAMLGFARHASDVDRSLPAVRPQPAAACSSARARRCSCSSASRPPGGAGRRVRAVVGGLGLSGDAHHPTAPRPDGSGIARSDAARRSAERAWSRRADVGWVNAHGTGTPPSDAAEAAGGWRRSSADGRAARVVVEGCARPLHGRGHGDRGGAHRDRAGDGMIPPIGRLRRARRRRSDSTSSTRRARRRRCGGR